MVLLLKLVLLGAVFDCFFVAFGHLIIMLRQLHAHVVAVVSHLADDI